MKLCCPFFCLLFSSASLFSAGVGNATGNFDLPIPLDQTKTLSMNGIIYIFGPSCSGKSTLAEVLQKHLGPKWTYIGRDELIEGGVCAESMADKNLDEKIQELKDRVIVDAQIPWKEKNEGEVYCLLLPPLEKLLERDTQRAERLGRSERRAVHAREYVVSTHDILYAMDRKKFDICVDSSLLSAEETALKVLQLLVRE